MNGLEPKSKFFRFTDPRQERFYRRLSLLGPGPAAFYRDACWLMAEDKPLETKTHLVAHCLREVEGALRQVLLPYGCSLQILDELLAKALPSTGNANLIQNKVPNNPVTLGYFFDKLNNPAWLEPLKREGFFSHPPEPVLDDERGTVGSHPWPESRYLARMAALPGYQEKVLERTLPGLARSVRSPLGGSAPQTS